MTEQIERNAGVDTNASTTTSTDEQILEIAEPFWLKDAKKEGEFFDALKFARAVLAAQRELPLTGYLITEDGGQFVDFVMPGDVEGIAAYQNADGVTVTEVVERMFFKP